MHLRLFVVFTLHIPYDGPLSIVSELPSLFNSFLNADIISIYVPHLYCLVLIEVLYNNTSFFKTESVTDVKYIYRLHRKFFFMFNSDSLHVSY